jgi:hypothetical protein
MVRPMAKVEITNKKPNSFVEKKSKIYMVKITDKTKYICKYIKIIFPAGQGLLIGILLLG